MTKKIIKSVNNKTTKTAQSTARAVKQDSSIVIEKGRELMLATVGAAAIVRKQGEKLFGNWIGESKQLRKQATQIAANVVSDVQEQANGVIAQVKSATAANLGWVGEKAQDQMGKVLNRIGVPTKADVNELSRRVNELHKQVKALKKAA